jgi:diguanylate cyclase (GGDEF)-like protein
METHRYSVLIVDDQEATVAMLTDILKNDYNIYSASNGKDAISIAKKFLPNLILLDILMPDMDGYAVIAKLKKMDSTKEIPVIFITSLDGEHNEEKALVLGAADYITKPFGTEILKLRSQNQLKILEQINMIKRLSMHDQLTSLPNRHFFEEQVATEWRRALREKVPMSLMMIDIDHFKNYNDTHGHLQGDVALRVVAKAFSETLKRPGDFIARWGGEEFIVLLTNVDLQQAVFLAEKLRKKIESAEIPLLDNSGNTKLTVSIGVDSWKHSQTKSLDALIVSADNYLYTAKRNGRNQVCFDNSSIIPNTTSQEE